MEPNITVKGVQVNDLTQCSHYGSSRDIIAIKFKCCDDYYECIYCHNQLAGHDVIKWKKAEFNNKAVLCGNCKNEMTINEYLSSGNKCPNCGSLFNPKCSDHYHFYFEM